MLIFFKFNIHNEILLFLPHICVLAAALIFYYIAVQLVQFQIVPLIIFQRS